MPAIRAARSSSSCTRTAAPSNSCGRTRPYFNSNASIVLGSGIILCGAVYAMLFLQTRRYHPLLDKSLGAVVLVTLGMLLASAFLNGQENQQIKKVLVLVAFAAILLFVLSGLVAARTRFKQVRFYVIAWTGAVISSAIMTARHWPGIEISEEVQFNSMRIVMVLDAALMGLAIWDHLQPDAAGPPPGAEGKSRHHHAQSRTQPEAAGSGGTIRACLSTGRHEGAADHRRHPRPEPAAARAAARPQGAGGGPRCRFGAPQAHRGHIRLSREASDRAPGECNRHGTGAAGERKPTRVWRNSPLAMCSRASTRCSCRMRPRRRSNSAMSGPRHRRPSNRSS